MDRPSSVVLHALLASLVRLVRLVSLVSLVSLAVLAACARLGAEGLSVEDHWSFRPLRVDSPPDDVSGWSRGAVDRFIVARLRAANLRPAPEAGRVDLIRRIYLDVLGLPPTPEAIERFVDDRRPGAYERLVDSVLASPHYGERWGRHWLDVVRFAESNGYETNRERPNAYHFRDYVITSLNEDKPYDRFVKEQIAGDVFGAQVGTGFLVAGVVDIVKSPDINLTLTQRQDELADMIGTTGSAFLGLTLGCARCHDHKFDPVTQKDYYSLAAIFSGVSHGERTVRVELSDVEANEVAVLDRRKSEIAIELKRYHLLPAVNPRYNVETFAAIVAKRIRFTIFATTASEPCIDELEVISGSGGVDRNVALRASGAVARSSSDLQGFPIHKLEHVHDGKYGNSFSWISGQQDGGWVEIELDRPHEIHQVRWGRDREGVYSDRLATNYKIEVSNVPGTWTLVASSDGHVSVGGDSGAVLGKKSGLSPDEVNVLRSLLGESEVIDRRRKKLAGEFSAYVGMFSQPGPTYRLHRGDALSKRELVSPDTIAALGKLSLNRDSDEMERRRQLALWLVRDDNPLTPRVIVNRIWKYHFGTGLVATPSDFGRNGAAPSHDKLLDWLAVEFLRSNWSLKRIHKLLLTSSTYRQSSAPDVAALRVDAGNRLLWRFRPRRLEAEVLRDSILRASGVMNYRMGGPGFYLLRIVKENVRHYFPLEVMGPDEWRRMVYMTKIRQEQDDVFGIFDCPDGNQVVPVRGNSTTPLQALNLLNSRFILEQAAFFADRLRIESGSDVAGQVVRAFDVAFGREPDTWELGASIDIVTDHGLPALCRAIFNANEFLFLP